jgi:Putative amidoligase enzyme
MLSASQTRRFGVEIELNRLRVSGWNYPDVPEGMYNIGQIVVDKLGELVEVKKYGHTHHNNQWVLKPDSSCGLELVTPVLRGWNGTERLLKVIEAIGQHPKVEINNQCSLHVHVEVSDCTVEGVARVLSWWLKCEAVLLDAFPPVRKRNRYCQFICNSPKFDLDTHISPEEMIREFGHNQTKYGSINTLHLNKGRRPTIEFRLGEEAMCCDPYSVKNWVRFILHFTDMTSKRPLPAKYQAGNVWTGWHWLDPEEVLTVLGFDGELSPGMKQVKDWFLARLAKYTCSADWPGCQGENGRSFALKQVNYLLGVHGVDVQEALAPHDLQEALYGKIYRQ